MADKNGFSKSTKSREIQWYVPAMLDCTVDFLRSVDCQQMMDCGENDSKQIKNRLEMDGNCIVLFEIDPVWMQER